MAPAIVSPASCALVGLLFVLARPAGAHEDHQCSESALPCDATHFLQTTVTTDAAVAPAGDGPVPQGPVPPSAPAVETFASQWRREVEAQRPDHWRVLHVLLVASVLLAVRLFGPPSAWLWSNTSPPLGQLPAPPKPAAEPAAAEADGHRAPAKEAESSEVFLEPVSFGGW
mmetsp:Transcript_91227/g.237707  ORF Transcript_91227/g.237707 Transcript_91227/m.237707 type:complete len:171 (+) Transcript_91227:88-600(+)